MVCLLDNLPEVQAQIKKLADIIGDEDVAYYVLSENNGYDLDLAPNGKPSKLYQDLLIKHNDNSESAIVEKAKTYSPEFRERFGDWLSQDNTAISEKLDDNGEPLIGEVTGVFASETEHNVQWDSILTLFPDSDDFNRRIESIRQSFNEGIQYNQQHDTEQSRKELEQALSGLTQKILEGQQKRLKVVDDPDPSIRARIKKEMEWQITNITNGLVDNITNITNFVNSLRDEVRENILFLQEHINNGIPIDDRN